MAVARGRKEAAKIRKANGGGSVPYIALISDEHYRLPLTAHEVELSWDLMEGYRELTRHCVGLCMRHEEWHRADIRADGVHWAG